MIVVTAIILVACTRTTINHQTLGTCRRRTCRHQHRCRHSQVSNRLVKLTPLLEHHKWESEAINNILPADIRATHQDHHMGISNRFRNHEHLR